MRSKGPVRGFDESKGRTDKERKASAMFDDYDKYNFEFNNIGGDLALANGAVLTVIERDRANRYALTRTKRFSSFWIASENPVRFEKGGYLVSHGSMTAKPGSFGVLSVASGWTASAAPVCCQIETGLVFKNITLNAGGSIAVGTGSIVFGSGVFGDAGRNANPGCNAGKTTIFVESSPDLGSGSVHAREAEYTVVNRSLSDIHAFSANVATRGSQHENAGAVPGNGQSENRSGILSSSASGTSSGKRSFTINAEDAAKFTSCQLGGDTVTVNGQVSATVGKAYAGYVSGNTEARLAVEDGSCVYDGGSAIGVVDGGPYSYCGGSPFFDESTGSYIIRPWYGWIEIPRPYIWEPEIIEWEEYSVELDNEWVRFDDGDYSKIDLEYAAKLSFSVNTKDTAKFTVYRCVEGEDGSCTLTELQTTSLSFDRDTDEYAATTKALLLEAGQYYISIQSANAAEDGSDYKVCLNDEETEFFTDGDNSDDWTDLKTEGFNGEVGYAGMLDEYSFCLACDWVGFGDEVDYMGFSLDNAAKLSFSIDSSDAAKFTLYQLVQAKNGTYSLKMLQSVTLSFDREMEDYEAATKALLLEAGDYYFSVQSMNAAQGGSAYYNVYLDDENSSFFTRGDNSDDWTDLRTEGDFGQVGNIGLIDENSYELLSGWVGYGDAVDYAGFTLANAAKLSFSIDATESVCFTIYQLIRSKDGTYSLKALQTTSLSFNKEMENYEAMTKSLLLQAGDYYISVQSQDAAKGGSAEYEVRVNDEETEFFTEGDNSDDWTDLKTEGDFGQVGYVGAVNEDSFSITSNWVGFGDAVDYAGFTLTSTAKLSFSIDATDSVKFTIYQLVQSKDGTYSLKALQTTSLFFNKEMEDYEAVTKALLLEAGDYYFSVQSTNAAQGGSAYYNVCLDWEHSEFFTEWDGGDSWTDLETEGPYGAVGYAGFVDEYSSEILSGWVGFKDSDYAKIELASAAKLSFSIDATDAAKFTVYQLVQAKNGKYSLNALQTATLALNREFDNYEAVTKALLLEAGEYYISMESTNAAQGGSAYYTVSLNSEGSEFFTSGENWDDWADLKTEGSGGQVGYVGALDENSFELLSDWVGFGDAVDYAGFTLTSAAKLSFSIDAADAVKFTVYQLVQAKNGTYSLNALQTVTLALNKEFEVYEAVTKALLLEAGDYYFSVQSMNAAQGGSANYNVYFNGEDSEFFTSGDNYDDWTDLKTEGDSGMVGDVGVLDAYSFELCSDWVGFGDAVDYMRFTLFSAAKVSFSVDATGASAFTVYQLVQSKSGTYSLNALQTTALSFNKEYGDYEAATKALLLEAGDYYFSMQSTNAAQGGSAYYNIYLNSEDSEFFTDGDNWDDWTDLEKMGEYGEVGEIGFLDCYLGGQDVLCGWVGFGDAADYAGFTIDGDAKLSFDVSATDAVSFTVCSLVQAKNGTYSLKTLQSTPLALNREAGTYEATTKTLSLEAGRYYILVQSTNAAQGGSAYYGVQLNGDSCEFLMEDGSVFYPYSADEDTQGALDSSAGLAMPGSSGVGEESSAICRYPSVDELLTVSPAVVETGMTCAGSALGFADSGLPENEQAALLGTASIA